MDQLLRLRASSTGFYLRLTQRWAIHERVGGDDTYMS
jgi:hypothetical protein